MSAPSASEPRTCPACGQPLPCGTQFCATPGCGHSDTAHEFRGGMEASSGQRGKCARFTPGGRCPCPEFTPAGDAGG